MSTIILSSIIVILLIPYIVIGVVWLKMKRKNKTVSQDVPLDAVQNSNEFLDFFEQLKALEHEKTNHSS